MFKNEREFVAYFLKHCKAQGIYTMRIETARTVNGCPDAWIQGAGDDFWIEFKNIATASSEAHSQVIHWRPGQQAWFCMYRVHHTTINRCTLTVDYIKCGWTVVAVQDEIWFIKMDHIYTDNCVCRDCSSVYIMTKHEFSTLDILTFLKQHSYM
jgi:hypothetical protein